MHVSFPSYTSHGNRTSGKLRVMAVGLNIDNKRRPMHHLLSVDGISINLLAFPRNSFHILELTVVNLRTKCSATIAYVNSYFGICWSLENKSVRSCRDVLDIICF